MQEPALARLRNIFRPPRWRELALAVPLAPVLALAWLCHVERTLGLARIDEGQVGVVVDHLRGTTRTVDAPGYLPFVPWLQQVHVLDKRPCELRLEEGAPGGIGRGPKLQVRAKDGSSYWFRTYSVQYALAPGGAATVLADSGPGEAYKQLVPTFARSVLRDEFGRHGAEEIVLPENLRAATEASRARLNAALEPHGVRVLELSAPNPAFDPEYERAIERRKVHNQEVLYLRARTEELAEERLRRLAVARKENELARGQTEAALSLEWLEAQRKLIGVRAEADAQHAKVVAAGGAARQQRIFAAGASEAKVRAEAESLAAEVRALATLGPAAVREALIEGVGRVPIQLVPVERSRAGEAAGAPR